MAAVRRHWKPVLLVALFLVALVPRTLYPVSRPLQWYERSFRFVAAVRDGRWADTVVSEHPGVVAMWLTGLAQHAYTALQRARGDGSYSLDAVDRGFRTEVLVSLVPLAIAIALGVLLAWWLLKQLFGELAAWAGASLLALDPFHVAVSKVVHIDALLSILMLLSALSLLLHLRRSEAGGTRRAFGPRYSMLLASGVLAGLAFLTKSPAYFLVPFVGLCLLVSRGRAHLIRGYLVPLLLWGGVAAGVYVLFWPAMWVHPIRTLTTVFAGILKHTGRAHPQPLYFLGHLTREDPGPGYYLLSLVVKTTPLSLPLFIVGLVSPLAPMWRRERRSLGLMVAYFAFFFLQMSLGAKKAPRYLLPAFPALAVVAGVGLAGLARRLALWRKRLAPGALVAATLILQAMLVLPYHPYYSTHANLLVGGPRGARRILLSTPEGEGLDLVAGHLNELPGADRLRVGVQLPAREAFSQYFKGEVCDTREPALDYLVFADDYITRGVAEDQWGAQWEAYRYRLPEYTAYLHGLPYAWAYRVNDRPQPPAEPSRVCLGGQIQLLGHTLVVHGAPAAAQDVRPGDTLGLTLHWAATGTPEGDFSVFVHLLGPDGALVTQQDNTPQGGTYPTFLWREGERLDDVYDVVVPADGPSGSYALVAGMYDWRTGERLPALADCATPLPGNHVQLAAVDVRSPGVAWWQVLTWVLAGAVTAGGLLLTRLDLTPLRGWLRRWWMPLAYTVITLVMTYPAVVHLGDRVISSSPDAWIFWWNNWWVKKALTTGQSVYYTKHQFFPSGVDLTYHSFSWLNTAVWMLLEPLVGSLVAYNLTVLWVFPIAACGTACLVRELTGSRSAAFLAGLVYAFVPYRLGQYNHPNLMGTQWAPFLTLYLLRAIRGGRWRPTLFAGLFLVLAALVGWNQFLYMLIWIAFVGAYAWITRMGAFWRLVRVVAGVIAVALLALSPLLFPMLRSRLGSEETLGDVQQDWTQTDLLAYVLPNRFHPLWGRLIEPVYQHLRKPNRVVSVGYAVMALLGYSLARRHVRRRAGMWWAGILLWWLMALGPFLRFNGHIYPSIPLPYYPLSRLYAFQLLKLPDRYNLILSLPVAVVTGYAAADLVPRFKRRWRAAFIATLSALVLFEYASLPVRTQSLQVPRFYEQLADEEGDAGIVELPIDFYGSAKWYLLYQVVHGHPIAEGHISRRPPAATAYLDAHPLLRSLYRTQEIDPALTDVSRQLRALNAAGFRYLVIHKQFADLRRAADWQKWLVVTPAFEDQDLVAYSTQPSYGQNFGFIGEVGDGIGVITSSLSSTTLPQAGQLDVELVWGTRAAPAEDWLARVALVSSSGSEVAWTDVELCTEWPTSQWEADEIVRGRAALRLTPFVEGGTYKVTVGLAHPAAGEHLERPLELSQVQLSAVERVFERPKADVSHEALLGDALRFLGFDRRQEASALHLTLHWQAERRMDIAYKFFVHILDSETGELVTQADVMPRDWTYPTTWWEAGEVVSDEIHLPLSDVPPGLYDVIAGVYNPDSGTRLPVADTVASSDAADYLLLMERLVLP